MITNLNSGSAPRQGMVVAALAAMLGVATTQPAMANPWNSTTTDDTVTVGPTGDYATLGACATAFNAQTGINANWVVNIQGSGSPYTEAATVPFAKAIAPGKTVTIKPANGSTVSINFSAAAANAGVAPLQAGIMIGVTDPTDATTPVATDRFIIDGSNNGTSTQDLTLTNATQATFAAQVINVVGGSADGIIKNCIITNNCTQASQNSHGVMFTARYSGVGNSYVPQGWTVQNCTISSSGGTQTGSVGTTLSGTANSGVAVGTVTQPLTITSNTLIARHRGIWLNQSAYTNITNNRIQVGPQATNNFAKGIEHVGANGTTAWVMNITGNTIDKLEHGGTTAAAGIAGMELTGVGGGLTGTYNVSNNIISGFNFTGAVQDKTYRGIFTGSVGANLNAYHNSIYMTAQANVSGATVNKVVGIGSGAAGFTGTLDIKNNIIKSATDNGIAIYKNGAGGTFTSNYNDLSISGTGAVYGRINATSYANFTGGGVGTNWKDDALMDANGATADPTVAQAGRTGVWTSATNLHWTAAPGFIYTGTPIGTVTTDIDGEARSLSTPFMGADELITGLPVSVSAFTIE